MATWGVALSVLPWSWLADRIGRLRAMKIAISTAALAGLLVALSPGIDSLLVVRFFEGVALGGLPALAMTYLHDEVHPRSTAAAAAAYISGTTIGGASGRLIAGPLTELVGWRLALAAVAVVCLGAALVFLRLMPPARSYVPRRRTTDWSGLSRNIRHCLSDRTLLALYAQPLLIMGGLVAVYNYLGFRLEGPSLRPAGDRRVPDLRRVRGRHRVVPTGRSRGAALRPAHGPGHRSAGHDHWHPADGEPSDLTLVIIGLLILTAGAFAVHAVASAWVGHHARVGRAQATALYNVSLYTGSAVIGWVAGFGWVALGWPATAGTVVVLAAIALLIATRIDPDGIAEGRATSSSR